MPAIALILWPVVAAVIFKLAGPARGLIWATLIGYLFLPEDYGFDLPGLPSYDKVSVISFSIALGALITWEQLPSAPAVRDGTFQKLVTALVIGVFLCTVATILLNRAPLMRFGVFQQGHSIRDLVSMGGSLVIALTPFLLARRLLASEDAQKELLRALVILGLVYSFLILFERRMSPQLHLWIYGIQHDAWIQHLRGGGFRPMVFLTHGLAIGFFLFFTVVAAVALAFSETGKLRTLYLMAGLWLLLVLALSRNLGALMLAFMFVPALVVLSRRTLLLLMTVVVVIFVSYPAARQSDILPIERFVSFVSMISEDRASSFEFRLRQEDSLLERGLERPFFGWGGWGRSRVINELGEDTSVTDGLWVIRLGQNGWLGYFTYFGLLFAPLLFLWRQKQLTPVAAGLALMITGNLVYIIPNASLGPMSWLVLGALTAYVQYARRREDAAAPDSVAPPERGVTYSRFPVSNERSASAYSRGQRELDLGRRQRAGPLSRE